MNRFNLILSRATPRINRRPLAVAARTAPLRPLPLLLGILISMASGCSEGESAGAAAPLAAPVSVTVAPVRLDSAQRTVDVVGTLHGDEDATISAKVPGRIVAVHHDVGDRVRPAQPLAQIETRDYELARSQRELAVRESLSKLGLSELPQGELDADAIPTVRKARLEAQNAEARFNRGKQLYEQQPPRLSEQEYADLQTAWEVARNEYQVQILTAQSTLAEARARQAELELSEQQLADTTIRAPGADGPATAPEGQGLVTDQSREYVITARLVSVGEYVSAATAVFRVVDDDPIKLRCDVPERFAGEVHVGQIVRVRVEAFDRTFTGTVTRINPQVDPSNRSFRVEAVIENPDRALRPGAFARASVETWLEPDVLFVPASAIVSFAGVNRVYVAEGGAAVERLVELGTRRENEVEIRSGLRPGDRIVTSGGSKLRPGTPLNVQNASAATAPAME